MLVKTRNMREEAKEENRLLTVQVQKLQEMNTALRDKEIQAQEGMWQIQDPITAQLASRKTTASQSNWHTEYHNMSSQACNTLLDQDKFNDEQVSLIIQSYRANVPRVIINGVSLQPKAAVTSINTAQLEGVSKLLNNDGGMAQSGTKVEAVEKEFEDVFKLVDTINAPEIDGYNGQRAGGSTPPRQHGSRDSTPLKASNGGEDDDPDDIPLSIFSVIKHDHSGRGEGPPDGDGEGNGATGTRQTDDNRYRDDYGEFQLVNSRNIEIIKFAGSFGCKITYIDFNDSMRNYIAIKGKDGDILNKLLTAAEKRGDEPITDVHLQTISKRVPKIWEYNRAIHCALNNWTTGDAKKIVTYVVTGGIDAWRRLYAEYLPMDQTKQDIILTEITNLEAVKENDVRPFLNRLEELRDKRGGGGGGV